MAYTYDAFNRMTSVENGDGIHTYAYRPDGLRQSKTVGGVMQLTDGAGNLVRTYDYDAFGNQRALSGDPGTDGNPFRYCGEYYDLETKTYYLRARNYDPTTGRFLSEDTYRGKATDPLSLNLYTYANNNPLLYKDSSGNFAILAAIGAVAVGAIVGGVINFGRQLIYNRGNFKNVNWRSAGASLTVQGAMDAKYFATSQKDAAQWGKIFYPNGGCKIISIEIPKNSLSQFYYQSNLDNIGPAYCGDIDFLNTILRGVKVAK